MRGRRSDRRRRTSDVARGDVTAVAMTRPVVPDDIQDARLLLREMSTLRTSLRGSVHMPSDLLGVRVEEERDALLKSPQA